MRTYARLPGTSPDIGLSDIQKARGGLLRATWSISNIGNAPGEAHLEIWDPQAPPDQMVLVMGTSLRIQPGQTVTLSIDWMIPGDFLPGVHAPGLELVVMQDQDIIVREWFVFVGLG